MWGFFPAQLLRTLAQLGVPDALADGPADVTTLAARTGTHPPSLRRLLTAGVGLQLVTAAGDDRYELAPAGHLLRTGAPGSLGNLAQLFCGDATWRAWGELGWSVRTGAPSFEKVTGRTAFAHIAADPTLSAVFTEAMAEGTRAGAPAIVAACDLDGAGTLCDVGGGNGTLLAAFLAARPELRGVLFDTADGLGDAATVLAGVADRCRIEAGDFFAEVPSCDAYVVKSVVHDWDDDRATALLARIRAAAPPNAALFLVEPVLPADPAELTQVPTMLMSDLNMLVCTGGRERTAADFTALLVAAGWRLVDVAPTERHGYSVLRAAPDRPRE
nr:acetylserotonin O-methyltransferase [Pseudonocardia sp. C8]